MNFKAQLSSNSKTLEETGNPGLSEGQLSRLAKHATEAGLGRSLLCGLKKEKVGTKKIQLEALKLAREAGKNRGGSR